MFKLGDNLKTYENFGRFFLLRLLTNALKVKESLNHPRSRGALGALMLSRQESQPFKLCLNHVETHGDDVL